jgi:hypothetical protein
MIVLNLKLWYTKATRLLESYDKLRTGCNQKEVKLALQMNGWKPSIIGPCMWGWREG